MAIKHLAAACALFACQAAADAQETPAPQTTVEVLELGADAYQRLTVPVTIQGQGPFRFMIDTGAQATVLSRTLADRLMLHQRETALLVGMASSRMVETTFIDNFMLGSRSFLIRQAPLVEQENIGGADGILGLDSLQDQRVLLDFKRGEIAVDNAEALGGNRGYEIVVRARQRLGQLIISTAELDGIPVDVIIDTGAQGSIGNMALLERLRRSREHSQTSLTDINGESLTGTVRIVNALDIGRGTIGNFAVMFTDSRPFHTLGLASRPAMILGMQELKKFRRVAIDFKTRRILFDVPVGSYENRFGFSGV